ncbi:MAG: 50S ribosomal protein L24 [archaeon]|nr:MAG: 50S ribosomal protein L24 [archaeon]
MRLFSKAWKSSKNKKKQRKYRHKADNKTRHKLVKVNLDKDLRSKYKIRSVEPRKGDLVKIMVGRFRKREGKIAKVDLKKYRINIEGIQISKKDGTKVNVHFDASNLQIKELNLDDNKRLKKTRG